MQTVNFHMACSCSSSTVKQAKKQIKAMRASKIMRRIMAEPQCMEDPESREDMTARCVVTLPVDEGLGESSRLLATNDDALAEKMDIWALVRSR
jgi:hypothetical protein